MITRDKIKETLFNLIKDRYNLTTVSEDDDLECIGYFRIIEELIPLIEIKLNLSFEIDESRINREFENPYRTFEDLIDFLYLEINPFVDPIESFNDAMDWCKKNGRDQIVQAYKIFTNSSNKCSPEYKRLSLHFRSQIIALALNEGWLPTFEKDEVRWLVINNMHKLRVISETGDITSNKIPVFKSRRLAIYAKNKFELLFIL